MAGKRAKKDSLPFGSDTHWRIAEFYLKRSEHAANFLRTLLFALAGTSLGFVLNKHYGGTLGFHLISLTFFSLTIATVVWSWEVQKSKSIERFKTLRDKGYPAYKMLEKELEKKKETM